MSNFRYIHNHSIDSTLPYKAKSKDGNWVCGYILPVDGNMQIIPEVSGYYQKNVQRQDGNEFYIGMSYEIEESTICKNVSKCDIEGNQIFEHDIIYNENDGCYYEVCWWDDLTAWMADAGFPNTGNFYLHTMLQDKIKVVGNMYDPESDGYKQYQKQLIE